MTRHISVRNSGFAFGALLGAYHVCWAFLVGTGWAKPVMDFVLWIHFIKIAYSLEPFEFGRAAVLVVATSVVGFVVGAVFAWVWNAIHKA